MHRPVSLAFMLFAALLLCAPVVHAQCLEGNCVNGSGTKLTRGHKYSGSFKNNHRHGFGYYEYPNGDKYEGQFEQGIIQGEGTYYFVNGDRYEGAFVDGKRHGVGTYYPAEGRIMKGVWENNVLVTPEQMVVSSDLEDSEALANTPIDSLGELDSGDALSSMGTQEADQDMTGQMDFGQQGTAPDQGQPASGSDSPYSEDELDSMVDEILK